MRYLFAPLLAGLLFSILLASSAGAQILHLDKDRIDFGSMKQHESRDTQVIVTNKGGGILNISDVAADCGCTVPTLSKNQLAPGESTFIDINFNSKLFNGPVTKRVQIFSNDPNTPEKTFYIQADVFAPLLITPPSQRMGFSPTPFGTTITKNVIFTATEAPELIIKAQNSRKDLFEISVINNFEDNPQVSALVITVPKEMPAGRQRDIVRVETNIENHETVDIDLSAWPLKDLRTNLDKINFRYKKNFATSIHVTTTIDDLVFKVTSVECDLPEIKFVIEEMIPNKQTAIRLIGSPIDKTNPRALRKKGRINGTVIIYTDLESVPTLEIPVTYMIRM